jgi:predicted anti-sigma-YlaC factor YlaD
MTTSFRCDDKTLLVSYLYGEVSDADRAAVEAHVATCAACADELASLGEVRADLARWEPPAADLGFQIVQAAPRPARRAWSRPAVWAPMALAAGLLLAVGAALANVEVQAANGGVTIRAGWSHPPLTAPGAVAEQAPAHEAVPVKTGVSDADMQKAMAALETRLRAEMASTAQRSVSPAAVPVSLQGSAVDRGETLQQVRNLVDESERRQQRELALRLAQLAQDFENQRRTDLVKIEQNFGQIESLTTQEAAHQRAITNYLVRASQRQ